MGRLDKGSGRKSIRVTRRSVPSRPREEWNGADVYVSREVAARPSWSRRPDERSGAEKPAATIGLADAEDVGDAF